MSKHYEHHRLVAEDSLSWITFDLIILLLDESMFSHQVNSKTSMCNKMRHFNLFMKVLSADWSEKMINTGRRFCVVDLLELVVVYYSRKLKLLLR